MVGGKTGASPKGGVASWGPFLLEREAMRKILLVVMALALLVAQAMTAQADDGPHIEQTRQAAGGWGCEGGTKIEPVEAGRYDGVRIVLNGDKTFDFRTVDGTVVTSVLVKGGPTANFYDFGDGVSSWQGLHAPERSNGSLPGLSHICLMTSDGPDCPKKRHCEPPKGT